MNLRRPSSARTASSTEGAAASNAGPQVLTVRPLRAAFGPQVSIVSVDSNGRLWMRFSTAMGLLVTGLLVMAIPLVALWYVGGGLVDSGQVRFTPDGFSNGQPKEVPPPSKVNPTELPLAHNKDSKADKND